MPEKSKRFEYIVNTSSDFITLISRNYIYELVNDAYIENIEKTREDIIDHHVQDVWGKKTFESTIKKYIDRCLSGENVQYVDRFEFGSSRKYMHVSYYPYRENNGKITHALVFSHDITRLGDIEAKLINYEFRDPLTGLFNGKSLGVILEMELEKAGLMDENNMRSLLFISLSNFQDIQLTHGHALGNMLLENTGLRIKELLREGDYVFRYEGNELVVLLSSPAQEYGPAAVAKKIYDMITIPYKNGKLNVSMNCHIGISLYPKDSDQPEQMIEKAAEALRNSIEENIPYAMYDKKVHEYAVKRLKLESDMVQAFEKEEFELYFQPIVDSCGVIKGCETLIRWEHPEQGLIPPSEFIPIAEKNGLIKSIGKWVIFQAVKSMKTWESYPVYISINLSSQEFNDEHLLPILQSALKQSGLETPDYIRLECTESMEMIDPEQTVKKMHKLHRQGFEIFLDDFGTGFSSLSYLKDLPASTLKLDKIFIDNIVSDPGCLKFLRLIIHMAESLEMKLIVEGVETREQLDILVHEGCSLFQGYYFSRPVNRKAMVSLLKENKPLPFLSG